MDYVILAVVIVMAGVLVRRLDRLVARPPVVIPGTDLTPVLTAVADAHAAVRHITAAVARPQIVEVEKPVIQREMILADLSPITDRLRALEDALRAVPTVPRRSALTPDQFAKPGDVYLVCMDSNEREVIAVRRVDPFRRKPSIEVDGLRYACSGGAAQDGYFIYRQERA